MKIAMVSDVHGNLEALQTVLSDIRAQRPDAIWSLGDAVGYGPEPQACVELLRREAEINLMGNHDAAVTGALSTAVFNENARLAVEWTRRAIDGEARAFLAGLPYTRVREGCRLVHSSPRNPGAWLYIMNLRDAGSSFLSFTEQVCFIGHTHVPFIAFRRGDDPAEMIEERETVLEGACRYLVNVGSVGQPRDGDPRAAYVLLDTSTGRLEIRRVAYDVEKTQELMRLHDLPLHLVKRLAAGR